MTTRHDCPLASEFAERLRVARAKLTERWLERITARVSMDPYRVFPTRELLDNVPLLLEGTADYIENPAEDISTDMPVVAKAMELGELRHAQGFDAHEILKEYEILGDVLFAFLSDVADEIPKRCTRGELLACAQRLFRAIALIQQVTTNHYLRAMNERIRERENRLRGFNRAVSHELKNRIGSLQSAGELLGEEELDREKRRQLRDVVGSSARDIKKLIDNMIDLSRIETKVIRPDIPLRRVVSEVVRKLQQLAQDHGVDIRVSDDLPDVRINAAAVELCLSNYLGNAIKYSDSRKPDRFAEVRAYVRPRPNGRGAKEVVVEVRDNGVGIPAEFRDRLFERFFRGASREDSESEGTGLGLSIVRDTVESLDGTAWAEHRDDGSSFAFSLRLTPPSEAAKPEPEDETRRVA